MFSFELIYDRIRPLVSTVRCASSETKSHDEILRPIVCQFKKKVHIFINSFYICINADWLNKIVEFNGSLGDAIQSLRERDFARTTLINRPMLISRPQSTSFSFFVRRTNFLLVYAAGVAKFQTDAIRSPEPASICFSKGPSWLFTSFFNSDKEPYLPVSAVVTCSEVASRRACLLACFLARVRARARTRIVFARHFLWRCHGHVKCNLFDIVAFSQQSAYVNARWELWSQLYLALRYLSDLFETRALCWGATRTLSPCANKHALLNVHTRTRYSLDSSENLSIWFIVIGCKIYVRRALYISIFQMPPFKLLIENLSTLT